MDECAPSARWIAIVTVLNRINSHNTPLRAKKINKNSFTLMWFLKCTQPNDILTFLFPNIFFCLLFALRNIFSFRNTHTWNSHRVIVAGILACLWRVADGPSGGNWTVIQSNEGEPRINNHPPTCIQIYRYTSHLLLEVCCPAYLNSKCG